MVALSGGNVVQWCGSCRALSVRGRTHERARHAGMRSSQALDSARMRRLPVWEAVQIGVIRRG